MHDPKRVVAFFYRHTRRKEGTRFGMSRKVLLAERVVRASKAARVAKASRLGITVSAVLTFMIFAVSYYGTVVGNFTFSVDRMAQNAGITIYDDATTKEYASRLVSTKVDNADGMTGYCGTEYTSFPLGHELCIPTDEVVTSVDGSHNGTSYLAYTFYVENAGDSVVDLTAQINVVSATKGADEAIRVRVIIDGEGTTYARRQTVNGPAPGELEPLTQAFYSINTVMYQEYYMFQPGEIKKVTVLLWYEGEDADHSINIVGGGVKLEMEFSVSKVYDLQ